ncbi:hypothetical protein ABZ929_14545 [Streptomyces physcomitrii]|uniref:hypothetical protein n=1 Tax=Streptomyces physcomitrii TaxID=2724184 RepID=UPI0033EA48C2
MSSQVPAASAAPQTSASAAGALLLCRAAPAQVAPLARLLGERMLLVPAGEGWSVLVPEGKPWLHGGEAVDRVLTGWATALAVGADWPVLALWWDTERGGYTLASGFRRTVGYEWLAGGTPVGEDEAMRTFAARLGLGSPPAGQPAAAEPARQEPARQEPARQEPVRQEPARQEPAPAATSSDPSAFSGDDPVRAALRALTRPDPAADARARLAALVRVLGHAGLALPAGLAPGDTADRLREVARVQPEAQQIEQRGGRNRREAPRGEHGEAVRPAGYPEARAGLGAARGTGREDGPVPSPGGLPARLLGPAQLALGLPLLVWGAARRNGGWAAAGLVLAAEGGLRWAYALKGPGRHRS